MQLTLTARQPFNFHSVVNSHGWVQLAPFRFDETRQTLSYVDRLSNGRVLEYRITQAPTGVDVDVTGRLSKTEQNEIAEKVQWMFGLDQDFSSFYKAARIEPKLRDAKRLARGRVLRSPTFFEDILKTILTTNTLWAATKSMNLNLIASFGDPYPLPGINLKPSRLFPARRRSRLPRPIFCGRLCASDIALRRSTSWRRALRPESWTSKHSRHPPCRPSNCAKSC